MENTWRLPTIKELKTLIKPQPANLPQIDNAVFQNCPRSYFWSGSPDTYDSNFAWVVYFGNGVSGYGFRLYDSSVRLVRSGQSFDSLAADVVIMNDFQVNLQTGTALDKNGMEWKIAAVGQIWDAELKSVIGYAKSMTWTDAIAEFGGTNNGESEMDLPEIAGKLQMILNEAQREAVKEHGGSWKEKYEYLICEIRGMKAEAKDLSEDMKNNGLTFGTVEAEGYLRCAITLCNIVDRIEANFKD